MCTELLSEDRADAYIAELRADFEAVRALHAAKKKQTPLVNLADARANGAQVDFSRKAPAPKFTGRRVLKNLDLAELSRYIDWGPFFQTWDLAGPLPAILDDAVVGEQARQVFADAQALLKKIIDGRWLQAHAVFGLYPATRQGADDICIGDAMIWHGLRMQTERPVVDGVKRPNRCLSDFIDPAGDHIGVFAVTAGLGVDKKEAEFLAQHDDYNAIMLKALADRLAEAAAEWLHERVRREFWGYAPAEQLSNEDLIAERYTGIRPPRLPRLPRPPGQARALRVAPARGDRHMGLTESMAMTPAASVSGFYLAHPDAAYFNVGRIGLDQLADWAQRCGLKRRRRQARLGAALGLS